MALEAAGDGVRELSLPVTDGGGLARAGDGVSPDLVLDRLLPLCLAVLVLVGGYRGQLPLTALSTTLLLLLVLARYWSGHALDSIHYDRVISTGRAFPGDEVELTLRLANRKWLPLPWIETSEPVPPGLALAVDEDTEPESGVMQHVASLAWHERVSWRYRVICRRRGVYHFGPADIASGDPLGISTTSARATGVDRLVVYPRIIPVNHLALDSDYPLGDLSARRWIFEDPSRAVGVRDYRREDSLRRIHWKATARRQELQSKLYEPTTTLDLALFLAGGSIDPGPGEDDEAFEHAVSVAASISHELIKSRHSVGLYTNVGLAEGQPPDLAPASGEAQLVRILEALAAVEQKQVAPAELWLTSVVPGLPWGTSVLVVAGQVSETMSAAIESLRRSGRRLSLLCVRETRDGTVDER